MDKKSLVIIAILALPIFSVFAAPAPAAAAPSVNIWPGTGVAVPGVENVFFVSGGGFDGGVSLWFFVEDWADSVDQLYLGSPEDYRAGPLWLLAKSTSTGNVPDFAFAAFDGDLLPATTTTLIGIAQSESDPDPADRSYRNVNIEQDIDNVPYLTMGLTEDDIVHVGDTITVSGEGFTPGGQVEIYWNNPDNLIATTTADDCGAISVDVTVPESPSGYMALLVYDVEKDLLALDSSGGDHLWFGLYVESSLELDGTSIRGQEEERFNLIGHGFAFLNQVTDSTDTAYLPGSVADDSVIVDGTIDTYHNGAEANANGYIRITNVELADDIGSTGWVDVEVDWETDNYGPETATGSMLVSDPAECAAASFDTSGSISETGNVGSSFTVYVWNFPANSNVQVKFGGVTFETTIHTDANGAGSADFTVPELPGGDYVVDAFYEGEHAFDHSYPLLVYTIEEDISVDYEVPAGCEVSGCSVSGDYIQSGWWIHVRATGLDPELDYEPLEDGFNIIENTDYEMIVGTADEDDLVMYPSELGTIEFRYRAFYDNTTALTGDPIDVELDTLLYTYSAVGLPDIYVDSPDTGIDLADVYDGGFVVIEAGEKPTIEIYDDADNLVPYWEYQVLVDGRPIRVRPVGDNVFTGDTLTSIDPVSFRWNVTSDGMHTLEVIKKCDGSVLYSLDVLVSDVDGPEHMYLDTTTVTYDSSITAYFWNFDSGETLDVWLDCTDQADTVDMDSYGAWRQTLAFDFTIVPMGDYAVYPEGYSDLSTLITVQPSPEPTEITDLVIEGYTGDYDDVFDIDWYNLEPNTRYQLLFDGEVVASATSDDYGFLSFTDVDVPTRLPGTYDLTLQKVVDGSVVENYDGVVPTAEIVNPLELPEEAFPTQLVPFTVYVPAGTLTADDLLTVSIEVDDREFRSAANHLLLGVRPGYDAVQGYFPMPNGDANEIVEVKVFIYDSGGSLAYESDVVAMRRVSGAGAFLVGADIANDLAYIKTKVDTIETSLSDLDATVASIEDGVATLNTAFGDMQASLDAIDATVTSIQGDVAEVSTMFGDVEAAISDVADAVASAKSDVLNAISDLASDVSSVDSRVSDVASSVDSLSGSISSLSSAISSIQSSADSISSSVSSLSSDLADVKSTVDAIKADTAGLANISTFVIVAAILAAITAVLEIVVLTRKK